VLPLVVGGTVLDAGCGYGRWGHLIRTNYWEAGLPAAPAVDGFDAFAPNVEICRRGGAYRRVWQQEMPAPLDGSWDTVLACELLEHLPQETVAETVAVLERAAARRVVFTTPSAPDLRPGLEQEGGFNEFEAHRSHVPRSFFRERGYRVLGAGLGRHTAPGRALTRLRAAPTLQSATRLVPALAAAIVAYKDVTRHVP
jgi:SAM-dependent methyltransferase